MKPKQEIQDITGPDEWWSIDRAALHLGVTRATIERYARQGLPVILRQVGGLVRRDALIAEYRRRQERTRATRAKPTPAE